MITTTANTQYKTVGVQWFARLWFSHQRFPRWIQNALRKPNRFILSTVTCKAMAAPSLWIE